MRKIMYIIVMISIIFILTGCQAYTDVKGKLFGESKNVTVEKAENCEQCPQCASGFDAAIYYFDDEIDSGFEVFLQESREFLDCSLIRLDKAQFNEILIRKFSQDMPIRLAFDKKSTMDCSGACIPYSTSQYNTLYGEGLDIKVIDNLHLNFCISEDGVFLTSRVFDESPNQDVGLYIKSDALRDVFEERFEMIWGD